MRQRIFSVVFTAALLGGLAAVSPAQVGSGWRQDFPSKSIQLRGDGTRYTNTDGIETFVMTDADERSEMRVHNDYMSGRKQFEGWLRASYGQGTSMHQIFKFLMIVYYPDNGGELRQHSYQQLATTGIQGVWVRVNTIHDTSTHRADIYINGSLKGSMDDAPPSAAGGWYFKYGVYNAGTQGAKAEWRDVKFFTYTGAASPTPTATPTSAPRSTPTPTPTPVPTGDVEVTPGAGAVTASTSDANLPGNVVDGNLATRWSSVGDGEWLKLDLGTTRTVTRVRLAVFNGNMRQNRFDLQVSSDDVTWTNVLTGGSTSGTTTLEETHELADQPARWVRYVGHGSSDPAKPTTNSLTEVSVFALSLVSATPTPTPTPSPLATPTPTSAPAYVEVTPSGAAVTASTHDGNLPANTVDNNLATRWSANGDGQWLQLDLGTERTVGHIKVAVYNGNARRNRFELQVSTGGGAWQTVWSGQSSGTTTAEETYEIADVPARWVRYLGHMNTVNGFNSVAEVSVFAVP